MANPTTVALAEEVNVVELWLYDCWKVETSQQDESHWFQHAMGRGSCILGYGSDLQWVSGSSITAYGTLPGFLKKRWHWPSLVFTLRSGVV